MKNRMALLQPVHTSPVWPGNNALTMTADRTEVSRKFFLRCLGQDDWHPHLHRHSSVMGEVR